MRKLTASLFLSLDGVMESPSKWHLAYWNDEIEAAVGAVMAGSDAMLLGRVTYEEFAGDWAPRTVDDDPGADFMNNTTKFVVSTTLEEAAWANSTVLRGDLGDEITRLKDQPGGGITVGEPPGQIGERGDVPGGCRVGGVEDDCRRRLDPGAGSGG